MKTSKQKESIDTSLSQKDKKNEKLNANIVQEDPDECVRLVEQSFLKNLFSDSLTDVSYNGDDFYAQDNEHGRYKINIDITNEEIYSLIKQIANFMLKPFSVKEPILDVSFGNYRLNAVHPQLARSNNRKVITFSIRCISPVLKIRPYDSNLCPKEVHDLLKTFMRSYQTILISGQTGSGKTELQKYLISFMNPYDRLILIEESYETHIKEIYPNLDVTSWLVNNNNDELPCLIRLALRNNPDWLIIAEIRGIEAYDMVQATMTGHSAITTIHSESCEYSLKRITQMCKKKIDFDEQMLLTSMAEHIKIGVHMEKIYDEVNEIFVRRIYEICEYVPTPEGHEINVLFKILKNDKLKERYYYGKISNTLKESLIRKNVSLTDIKKFIQKEANGHEENL